MVIVAVTPCAENFGYSIDRGLLFLRDRLRCMGGMGKWSLMAKQPPRHSRSVGLGRVGCVGARQPRHDHRLVNLPRTATVSPFTTIADRLGCPIAAVRRAQTQSP